MVEKSQDCRNTFLRVEKRSTKQKADWPHFHTRFIIRQGRNELIKERRLGEVLGEARLRALVRKGGKGEKGAIKE